MATRSLIAIQTNNNKIEYIYCHWDGHPKSKATILIPYYNTIQKVKELIKLGDISVIGKHLNPINDTHSFLNPQKDTTVAYIRDNNDKDDKTKTKTTTLDRYHKAANNHDAEYIYLFKNNQWYYSKIEDKTKKWYKLSKIINNIKQ